MFDRFPAAGLAACRLARFPALPARPRPGGRTAARHTGVTTTEICTRTREVLSRQKIPKVLTRALSTRRFLTRGFPHRSSSGDKPDRARRRYAMRCKARNRASGRVEICAGFGCAPRHGPGQAVWGRRPSQRSGGSRCPSSPRAGSGGLGTQAEPAFRWFAVSIGSPCVLRAQCS